MVAYRLIRPDRESFFINQLHSLYMRSLDPLNMAGDGQPEDEASKGRKPKLLQIHTKVVLRDLSHKRKKRSSREEDSTSAS